MHLLLADLILAIHALFLAFVILGLVAVLIGKPVHWSWVRNRRFRFAHLAAIAIVIAKSWLGMVCPLTEWESRSREAAGATTYSSPFIQHWLHKILFYDFEPWVFTAAYTAFGILVLVAWLLVPPEHARNETIKNIP